MSSQIAVPEKQTALESLTPMQMIQVAFNKAIEQGSAMEVVNVILEQQKWMIQHSEEEAFNAALKRIQRQLKSIPKRGWNAQTQSKFATAEDIDNEIQRLLDAENMTLSFVPAEAKNPESVLIIGTLALGAYSRQYPLEMPADGKGAKGGGVMTRTHATGSAITYGKRYLKNMIFDLRFKEKDDDGNGASAESSHMEEGAAADFLSLIEGSGTIEELQSNYFKARDEAEAAKDKQAAHVFAEAKNKMFRKLYGGHK